MNLGINPINCNSKKANFTGKPKIASKLYEALKPTNEELETINSTKTILKNHAKEMGKVAKAEGEGYLNKIKTKYNKIAKDVNLNENVKDAKTHAVEAGKETVIALKSFFKIFK